MLAGYLFGRTYAGVGAIASLQHQFQFEVAHAKVFSAVLKIGRLVDLAILLLSDSIFEVHARWSRGMSIGILGFGSHHLVRAEKRRMKSPIFKRSSITSFSRDLLAPPIRIFCLFTS